MASRWFSGQRATALAVGVFFTGALAFAGDGSPVVVPDRAAEKMTPKLIEYIEQAGPDDLIPVIVDMADQVSRGELDAAKKLKSRTARYNTVKGLLKPLAEESQADLLEFLAEGQEAGVVSRDVLTLWISNIVGFDGTSSVVVDVALRDDVREVDLDVPLAFEVVTPVESEPSENNVAAPTCGLNLVKAPQVWTDLGMTGEGIVVGVIDTGACGGHTDLVNQLWKNPGEIVNGIDDDGNGKIDDISGWNFEFDHRDFSDQNGHGTHTAGTIGGDGTAGTNTGVAPDAQIMVLEYMNSFAGQQVVWNTMQYAADEQAHVTSASIGWPYGQNPNRKMWREVCENTIAMGVTVIYAAGNEGGGNAPNNVRCPGDVPDVITVGAVNCNNNLAGFSSNGPVTWQSITPFFDYPYPPGKIKPTVSAPGVDTSSLRALPCDGYTNNSGTSMATPHVAGVAALILQANPYLAHDEVRFVLESTSLDLGPAGPDNQFGAGRVDAMAAVLAAQSMICCNGGGTCHDFDGEEGITLADQSAVPACLLGPGAQIEGDCACADADLDFDVDLRDIAVNLNAFGS